MWGTVSKRSGTSALATNSDEQDPAARRRVLHARYKLLRQLEAQVPAAVAQQDDEDENEQSEDEDQGRGECWLSKVLAGSLTLAVAAFICYVLALHRQRLRALFELAQNEPAQT
jgi:hypothetical protein